MPSKHRAPEVRRTAAVTSMQVGDEFEAVTRYRVVEAVTDLNGTRHVKLQHASEPKAADGLERAMNHRKNGTQDISTSDILWPEQTKIRFVTKRKPPKPEAGAKMTFGEFRKWMWKRGTTIQFYPDEPERQGLIVMLTAAGLWADSEGGMQDYFGYAAMTPGDAKILGMQVSREPIKILIANK